ncbi:MAG: TrmH family RNA methyltransferase [Anaerolineaceae bacterium]|jgi:TrmH family RNA methyltransferase|nr:MAG: RNA methyltransferase [Chloroflexi bacterium HGW-Chloroflexi-8]
MSEIITSTSNPKIKFVRKLHDRKFRDLNNVFYIEGVRIVGEAFSSKWKITDLLYSSELLKNDFSRELVNSIRKQNVNLIEIDKDVFKSISIKDGPQGLAAIVEKQSFSISDILAGGVWVALDRIQDPGNLGTVLRTVDAVGAKGIVLINHCVDPFDISAVRSSMGALFSLKIIHITSKEFIDYVLKNQILVIGSSDSGNIDFRLASYPPNMILLMGSEREGLSEELFSVCTSIVRIPMAGKSDSLNLAVATGICLYEIYNQNNPIK